MKYYEVKAECALNVKAESVTEALFKIHKLIEEMDEDIVLEDLTEHDVKDTELFDDELYEQTVADYENKG